MQKRKVLKLLLNFLISVGIVAIVYSFVVYMAPSKIILSKYQKEVDISSLEPGQYLEVYWHTSRVIIFHDYELNTG